MTNEPLLNRNHKDTLFLFIFKNPKDLLSLYNALNDTDYTDVSDLTVTTLEDIVYMSYKNQGQRSQSARGFCPRSTMRVPQPDIIEHFGNADAVPQPPERCLSRKAGIVRCCLK